MTSKKFKILIVDDSKTFTEYILSVLGNSKYNITTALTGFAGLENLKKSSFNLVLLDMQLPDLSGLEILRNIRTKHNQNELPVIFISASSDIQIIAQALEAGANDFIQKPVNEITLQLKIKNLLQLQQANEQLIDIHKKAKENETVTKKMLANIGDVIVIIDKDGINKYKSSNLEKCFGWKPEELIGRSTWENVHPNDLNRTQQLIVNLAGVPNAAATTECLYKRKDGIYVWIEITIVNLLHDPDIKGFLGNYRDISERKKTEEEIILKNEQLTLANSDKDRFMQILAHDLKNPFMTLLGFLGLLNRNVRKYSIDKIEEQLTFITHTTLNTYNLLDDLLEWIRAHSGKMQYNPKSLNLNALCNNVFEILNDNAMAKNICLSNNIAENTIIMADANMIKSVLRNLISNAIKFTNTLGTISVSAAQNLSGVIVTVCDNGIGMTEIEKNNLFSVTKVKSKPGTANERGTGLGLLLCKEFVEKHGGTIWVESELEKGSEFKFSLPLRLQ